MALRATELRIGNLVYFRNESYKVVLIANDLIKIDIGFGAVQRFEKNPIYSPRLDKLNPIPLTEEWLLMFGFKQRYPQDPCIFELSLGNNCNSELFLEAQWQERDFGDISEDRFNMSVSLHTNLKDWIGEGDEDILPSFWTNPKPNSFVHVHELQNLYFALTGGEELEIKNIPKSGPVTYKMDSKPDVIE